MTINKISFVGPVDTTATIRSFFLFRWRARAISINDVDGGSIGTEQIDIEEADAALGALRKPWLRRHLLRYEQGECSDRRRDNILIHPADE